MGTRRARGEEIAAQLRAAGVKASTDVGAVTASLPAVLIPPPALAPSMDGFVVTWRLVALASITQGSSAAWDQLDDLVDQVDAAGINIDRADPFSYQLPTGAEPVPAYALTFTETVSGG
jgi:hypothetical protein